MINTVGVAMIARNGGPYMRLALEPFVNVVNDIAGISEAQLRFGDDRSWGALASVISPGNEFTVLLNGRPRLKGRAEITEPNADVSSGTVFQLNIRTKKADAHVASAKPVTVQDVSIADFGISLYEQIGVGAESFRFAEFADRDLMTGKAGGAAPPLDFETAKPEQAKVQPPETIADPIQEILDLLFEGLDMESPWSPDSD